MPVKANAGTHDTQDMYKVQNVSYGYEKTAYLVDDTEIPFADNELTTATSVDERNLKHCCYLNLNNSSIEKLDTTYLTGLLVLNLSWCKISELCTKPLVNLIYLNIYKTKITELETKPLGKLQTLDA